MIALIVVTLACRSFVASRTGRLMLAARDDEARLRTLGYSEDHPLVRVSPDVYILDNPPKPVSLRNIKSMAT